MFFFFVNISASTGAANAAEIKVFTTRSIATVLDRIGPEFERTTGHKLKITTDVAIRLVRRINAREPFDFLVAAPGQIDELIKDGKIIPQTRTDLVRSGIGVAVRAGAPKPDISSVEVFKRALINAKSIAYLKEGQSGVYLAGLMERLEIAELIKSKVTLPDTDIVSELVAKGEIEIGMVVITQILTTPGVELVGPLPAEIQSYITFTAGVSINSRATEAAKELMKFLQGSKAVSVIKSQGMELVVKPISALEVKYRKQIFKNERFSVFLLEIPPNHASLMHRHDTDILSIFVAGGETKGTIFGKPPKEDKFTVGEVRFRPAGFTHSTENIGADVFRSVILEFTSSMGAVEPTKPPDSRYCNPGGETACVDEKYLFCTAKFCVQELSIAAGAVWRNNEYANEQMLIAVSDYKLSDKQKDKAANVRKRKSGEIEHFPSGSALQWKNTAGERALIIAVVFRQPVRFGARRVGL